MNVTISMDHVLGIIHSMPLTPSNKRWLGERLIDEAMVEEQGMREIVKRPVITKEDLTIVPQVARLFRNVPSMPAEDDIKKEYLCEEKLTRFSAKE